MQQQNTSHITASYANCMHNFVITGLRDGDNPNHFEKSVAAVVKNILSRSYPVKPSVYLSNKLGEIKDMGGSFALLSGNVPNWNKTIKGYGNDNPALSFFTDIWGKYIPDYAWVRELTIPEAPLDIILDDYSGEWKDQTVDFYVPLANLVIEIDGAQHTVIEAQRTDDIIRDNALAKAGILVIRISARSIKQESEELNDKISAISLAFSKSKNLLCVQTNALNDVSDLKIKYEKVMRYQYTLLLMIERGIITLSASNWTFNVDENDRELFLLSIDDLFIWIGNLYHLSGNTFTTPNVSLSESNSISILLNIFGRIDDSSLQEICIYNDYWDTKDYYEVSCADLINYDIDLKLHPDKEETLVFFLNNLFGYEHFNPGQLLIIPNILNLNRTIGVLPTGGGKSLCYQLCTLLQPAVSFSVCPITSLEIDQKEELDGIGFSRTSYIASTQTAKDKYDVIKSFGNGKYQVVWISPERFQSEDFRIQIRSINQRYNFAYAIIDEVHCLSEWGHDFRTSYLTLVQTIEEYCPQVTLVGLTATASQAVLKDLKLEFNIDSSNVKALPSLERKNLSFHVINTKKESSTENRKVTKNDVLKKILLNSEMVNSNSVGLIFTLYKDKTGEEHGFKLLSTIQEIVPYLKTEKYHADVPNKEDIQNRFKRDDINILSTTKAFGMGINKEDVRYTIHYELPWSVEAFYQEAGRAGRSTKREEERKAADCFIIYTPEESAREKETEALFKKDTSAESIINIQEKYRNELNDIGKIFYLWGRNNKGREHDIKSIGTVLAKINKAQKEISVDGRKCRTIYSDTNMVEADIELALYRLKVLRVICDWTRNWKNHSFTVYLSNIINEETVSSAFESYVRRHDVSWNINSTENEQYKTIIENYGTNREQSYIYRYAEALILWTYSEIIYSRRRMIQTIRDYCRTYTSPEDFKRRITNFLKITDQSVVLDGIVEETVGWEDWFNIFYEEQYNDKNELMEVKRLRSTYGIEEIRESAARYLESYRNSVGLNLIYVLAGALTKRYDAVLDEDLLLSSIKQIKEKYGKVANDIIHSLISFLNDNRELIASSSLESIIASILRCYRELARDLYEIFNDQVSLTYIINETTIRICKSLEDNV